jgi:pyruvate/2-oxoglutarate dehydrogenase complex dihydrolipoamide acyltransferase (E2) component
MPDVRVSEDLWRSAVLPEGIVERWLVADGAEVAEGDAVAEVRVEDALHDILAPAAGWIHIWTPDGGLFEPGSSLGEVKT